jgi:hypothetical protein
MPKLILKPKKQKGKLSANWTHFENGNRYNWSYIYGVIVFYESEGEKYKIPLLNDDNNYYISKEDAEFLLNPTKNKGKYPKLEFFYTDI